jgi:hypothetical protein
MKIRYIEVPKITDERWSLSFMEANAQIPFDIKRVYYIYDLKDNWLIRWEHAHFETEQVLFCIQWNLKIVFDDWKNKEFFTLSEPNKWIFIPKMMWHYMKDFSDNCIIMVMASGLYNESDYIRDYEKFINIIK